MNIGRQLMKLRMQLNDEWNKPKAKNAKPGQEARDYDKIREIQQEINDIKDDFKE